MKKRKGTEWTYDPRYEDGTIPTSIMKATVIEDENEEGMVYIELTHKTFVHKDDLF